MNIPIDVSEQLDSFDIVLEECKKDIIEGDGLSLLKKGENDSIQPLVAGRTFHSVAKLVLALSHTLLQCHGIDPKGNDFFKKERGRLDVYKKKIDKARATYEAAEKKRKSTLVMNVDTANKFISAALDKKKTPKSQRKEVKPKGKSLKRQKIGKDPLEFLHDLQKEAYQQ